MSIVQDKSPYGLYVWKLPDGSIFKDEDGNILNIPSIQHDIEKMKNIKEAAAYYGQPEGEPMWVPGVGRVTEEEYQSDLYRMSEGLTPLGDTGAWRDAARATRAIDQQR